ncbi:ATP-binding protein [Janthinobacterium sp. RB2R34]|uniref:ATP-binding protein n=1 Tax=Janthinobacterium sp. RB2R34 TaxID=3424193 RepID=UPI003F245579
MLLPFLQVAMNIAKFITENMEPILVEWEAFATTFGAVADKMSGRELRDHAKQILQFVAQNIQTAETKEQTHAKSQGMAKTSVNEESASSIHGRLRYASGFTLLQLIAEYRALRASVLKLWEVACGEVSADSAKDVMRFNEAIDQSLAEAAVAYAEKVNHTRDIFLAMLGHDLRSPLAVVAMAGAHLSKVGAFDEKVHRIGERVGRSAATMDGMVNDLLALARTQLGDGIPIERTPCDLCEMASVALGDAQAVHPHAIFELRTEGELTGAFDRPRLQQLLTNLANNAAQYGTPGRPIVVDVAGNSDRIVFKVSNEGPAISSASLKTMFDSLVQLPEQEGNTRPRSSLGLGLFIAKQIAVAHGGDISVQSDAMHGTVFKVGIPR